MIFGDKKRLLVLIKTRLAPWIISAIVLLVGFILTTVLWRDAKQHQDENLNKEFQHASDQVAKSIYGRLNYYETVMRGVKGYIEGSEKVSIEEFHAYVHALKLFEKKSGLMAIDQVEIVHHADRSKHIAEIRKQGLADYTIKPEGQRESYAPITLIEPLDNDSQNVVGFDTYTKPATREVMERSRDLGDIAISAPQILEPDKTKENVYGIVMCLPIYRAGTNLDSLTTRRNAIKSWVQTPVRVKDLIAGLQGEFSQDLDIEIYDGNVLSKATLIYPSENLPSKRIHGQGVLETKRKLNLGGRIWMLQISTTPEFEARVSNPHQPKIVGVAGTLLSLTLAMLTWILVRGRVDANNTYQRLFRQTGEGILMLDRYHHLLDVNPAALKMFGYNREEFLKLSLPNLLSEVEVERINPTVESLMVGNPHAGEWVHVRKDGTKFLVEVNARRLDNQRYFAILRDLTNRKRNEQRILRLNNLYQALSETNQAIVRMTDEADLFPLVCKCAVKYGGMQMAWIGKLDNPSGLILPIASHGNGFSYLENLNITISGDVPEGLGPTGTAYRENHFVITNNFLENTSTKPWHIQARQYNWKSAGAFPINRNGKPFAVLVVYCSVVDAFDKEEIDLMNEMAADITFALDNFDREAQRRLMQDKLKLAQNAMVESLERYTDLYEFAPIGYLAIDKEGLMVEVNWRVTSMFGLKRNQLNQHAIADFVVDNEKARWRNLFLSMLDLDAGEEINFDLNFANNNGSFFMANLNCIRMEDEVNKPILRVAMLDVTQLKRTEEAKQQTEVRLQATMDAIPDLLFETDIDGKYYFAHTPNQKLLAAPSEDLIGKTVQEVLPVDAAYVVMSAIHEADVNGNSLGMQFELDLPHGKFWFELSISKKASIHGEIPRFIVISRDITERKQAEVALRLSESHLRTIINMEPECIKIVDARGRLKEMNPAGLAMIEAESQQQVIGHPLLELVVPEYRLDFAALHKRVLAGESGQLEFEIIGLKGGRRWLETHAVPMEDNGEIVLLGVTRDITERKQAENNLRIAATAFESQEGMMVTDVNKIILRVNKAFTKITGYSAEEAVGQTLRLVSSVHHHEDFYQSMWESVAENSGWEGEVWNSRKNGEVYPQHLTISAVMGANGLVTNYVATFTDVTLRNAAEAEISHLAFYDVLTRLPNRRLLIDRLNHALSASSRLGWGGALLFLDLDHFKTLNDTLGHDVGDLLLKQVAERLIACVREGDTVARLGGDEFVVMLEDLSKLPIEAAAQAEAIANKILTSINQPYQLATNTYQTTVSIGVVLFNDHSQEVLLKHADIAMYQAKKMGRNTLCFFDPDMQEAINLRAALEVDLRNALVNKHFELYYQVQVDRLGNSLGAEALIRWSHPERGLISPLEFIPLAEETGLILPIGLWVIETACAQLKAWQQDPFTQDLTLSVNVSAKQFYQTNFATQVISAVKHYGINPLQLKLELTESVLLEKIEETITKMNILNDVGVNFSLDDFGTGYSSLQYLKLLPLYQLKIDRSFVRDIAINSSDQAIVRTVIAMAQTLNLGVIAEGVETEVQREFLARCNCYSYQGFLFGKPMPIEKFNLALRS